jgi:phosphatidylethanolamine/phosphatidyl-N-methylethanolamine N-methyltransferase
VRSESTPARENPPAFAPSKVTHNGLEYHSHFLTKIFRSPYYGCYALALTIFGIGVLRDHLYNEALSQQPIHPALQQPLIAYGLIAAGNVLVLTSMWALGVTGTYLGDYFGILMDERIEGFPFNVTGAPMYWGSTCSFLGVALLRGRPAGLLLTVEVFLMYWFALKFEEYVSFFLGFFYFFFYSCALCHGSCLY